MTGHPAVEPHAALQRPRIGIGINRDGGDTHPPGSLDHPARDFAAIGDEDFFEHQTGFLARYNPIAMIVIPSIRLGVSEL